MGAGHFYTKKAASGEPGANSLFSLIFVSAHLARGGAAGCVSLSRSSRDGRGERPSTPPPWVCGECGCVRVAPRRWLWCL